MSQFADISPVSIPKTGKKAGLSFEEIYHPLRTKENRVYTDREIAQLPDISNTHPHYKEWQIRKQSSDRLTAYFEKKQVAATSGQPLRLLEMGCGNGWLSHRLATIPNTKVTGLDINFAELQQAVRVFENIPNLQFIYGDISNVFFQEAYFDAVIFAASIQYFSSLTAILHTTARFLKPGGEIHILDSHFYKPGRSEEAKERTESHFRGLGFPEMAEHYFHHCSSELEDFNYRVLYKPPVWGKFFGGNSNPFNWICITI